MVYDTVRSLRQARVGGVSLANHAVCVCVCERAHFFFYFFLIWGVLSRIRGKSPILQGPRILTHARLFRGIDVFAGELD